MAALAEAAQGPKMLLRAAQLHASTFSTTKNYFPISSGLIILQPEIFPSCLAEPLLDNLFFKSSPKMLYFALVQMIHGISLVQGDCISVKNLEIFIS